MNELKEISTKDLEAELNKRTANGTMPMQFDEPILKKLRETCAQVMEEIAINGYSKDGDHYIYEAALESIYGPNVWEWKNKHDKGC